MGGCYTPGFEGDEYNNPATDQISMPSTLADDPLSQITLINSPPVKKTVCMWAETFGGTKIAREIEFEICGTEGVTIVGDDTHTFDMLYRDEEIYYDLPWPNEGNSGSHVLLDLSIFNDRFVSDSPNCPIREWELYDSDGNTLLID